MTWTVDYGNGPEPCEIPHSWRGQDVRWEGPAIYRTTVEASSGQVLRFHGVSYEAVVSVNGREVLTHRGIWDPFDVPLAPDANEIEVRVTKNGGERFPVRHVMSGFYPYIFQTWGGVFRPVEVVTPGPPPPLPKSRLAPGRRGLLTWGWYPEVGCPTPTRDIILKEIREAKARGFDSIKFCLWVPPHEYLDLMAEEGMSAWMELPVWDPHPDHVEAASDELLRIVDAYRHHPAIAMWTIGCELSHATPPEWREKMVRAVQERSGNPLVKDNSGGAEMYGGDPREYGTFYDYHPYCDGPRFGPVLDSLLPGMRASAPIYLGETNEYDVVREWRRVHAEDQDGMSPDPARNDQGVRWQYDFPHMMDRLGDGRYDDLIEPSRKKSLFIRKTVAEMMRARPEIRGYVVTGIRDTPISTAGLFDDRNEPRFTPEECLTWNGPEVLVPLPNRRPPWIDGGNRPGWISPYAQFAGRVHLPLGLPEGGEGVGEWRVLREGAVVASGELRSDAPEGTPTAVGAVSCELEAGDYVIEASLRSARNAWPLAVCDRLPADAFETLEDPLGLMGDAKPAGAWGGGVRLRTSDGEIVLATDVGTLGRPFWRECAFRFPGLPTLADRWDLWWSVGAARALDPASIGEGDEVLMQRIDTRTYEELPMIVRRGHTIIAAIAPWGGGGEIPSSFRTNAAAHRVMRVLLDALKG